MSSHHESLDELETGAMEALQAIDLDAPAQQLRRALEALLDVPTVARRGESALSRKAATTLAALRQDVQRLHEAVQMLGEHIERPPSPWRPRLKGPYVLMAGSC